jgi:hypothetical protein
MNPLFVATPSSNSISAALRLWPELDGMRIRPLLVSAFGDIFVEASTGEVWVTDPIELTCQKIASSTHELQQMFSNAKWAQERLLTEVVLLALEKGKVRPEAQVFAIAPHPHLGGKIRAENLVAMDLEVWHQICTQLKNGVQATPPAGA